MAESSGSTAPSVSSPTLPMGHPQLRVSPARTEPVARGFIEAIGGPLGRFAVVGSQRWWTPLRVLLLAALTTLSFGYLAKANCLVSTAKSSGAVLNWSGNRQYMSACYNDITPLFHGRGLDQGGNPYAFSWVSDGATRYMEYPALAGLFQGAVAWISRVTYPLVDALPHVVIADGVWYFMLTALVMSLMWLATIRIVVELTGNRVWDVVLIAASPVVIVHAFTNWDIPPVFLLALGMLAVKRGHPLRAGMWFGLGAAFKMFPLFALGAYAVLAVRSRKWRGFLLMCLTTAASWAVVNVPIAVAYPQAWREFLRLNSDRTGSWNSIYQVIHRTFGVIPGVETLNSLTFILFAGSCIAVGVLGLMAYRRPRVAELIFLILAAFLLFNKVWSPQYSLWLVVPAVLAVPRWRLLLVWMATEMLVYPATMMFIGADKQDKIPAWLLDSVVTVRDGLVIALMVIVVAQILGRVPDKVYDAHGGADPLAGLFGQQDSAWWWRLRGRRQAPATQADAQVAEAEPAR